jgi:hypothetical protein
VRGSDEDYLARFSSKTRLTFGPKHRKLAALSGGTLDIRNCSTPTRILSFYAAATRLSPKTDQTKLLGAGLREGEGAHKKMFGTDSIEACSFLVLKRTFANIALIKALDAFDAAIARVRDLVEARGSKASLRNMLRR